MRLRIVFALLVAATNFACDPCAGVARCSAGDYLSATGQVVERANGRGVDGVRLGVVRVGGIAVSGDSVSVVTSDGGFWRAEFAPVSTGTLYVDVEVSPPGRAPYRVRGLPLVTREHGGDASLNERWVTRPFFNDFAQFVLRGTPGDPVANTRVEFRRTGGVPLEGPGIASGVYARITDAAGYYRLFPYADADTILPRGNDPVVGDITVLLGGALGTSVVRNVTLSPTYRYDTDSHLHTFSVGPSLGYLGSVRDSATGKLLPGVTLSFQRTGGIPITPEQFTTLTGPDGIFGLPPVRALAAGVLDGRFVLKATPTAVPETLLVHIPTVDVDVGTLPPLFIRGTGATADRVPR